MTILIPFLPTSTSPFRFRATLDGAAYSGIVTWNIWQRWYVHLYTISGVRVVTTPMVASPVPRLLQAVTPMPLLLASLTWFSGLVTATAAAPHGFTIGSIQDLTIAGASPAAYDGEYDCVVISATQFTYALPTPPAGPPPATVPGTYSPTAWPEALRWERGVVTATTADPLPYRLGTVVNFTVANTLPASQNGAFRCTVQGPTTFTYPLPIDPHVDAPLGSTPASVRGTYSPDLSLVAGLFASTLVWRPSTGNLEVNP